MSGTMLVEFTDAEHEKFVAWYQSITGGKQCNIIPPKFSPQFDDPFSRRRGLYVELDNTIWRETEGTKVVSFDYNIGDRNSAIFSVYLARHLVRSERRFKPKRIGWDSIGWIDPNSVDRIIAKDIRFGVEMIVIVRLMRPFNQPAKSYESVHQSSKENKQQQLLFRQELQAGVNRLFDETSDKSEFLLLLMLKGQTEAVTQFNVVCDDD